MPAKKRRINFFGSVAGASNFFVCLASNARERRNKKRLECRSPSSAICVERLFSSFFLHFTANFLFLALSSRSCHASPKSPAMYLSQTSKMRRKLSESARPLGCAWTMEREQDQNEELHSEPDVTLSRTARSSPLSSGGVALCCKATLLTRS